MSERQVTIIGSDTLGYRWTCGQCGAYAQDSSLSRDEALQAWDMHWTTAPSVPVPEWIGALLTAGQALADAAATDGSLPVQRTAWATALQRAPAATIAAWQSPGNVHPA